MTHNAQRMTHIKKSRTTALPRDIRSKSLFVQVALFMHQALRQRTLPVASDQVSPKGRGPGRRSEHGAVAVEGTMFVIGGRSSTSEFKDMFALDTEEDPPVWTEVGADIRTLVSTSVHQYISTVVACRMSHATTAYIGLYSGSFIQPRSMKRYLNTVTPVCR